MDFTPLLTAPVLAIAAALIIICTWIGYALGKSNEGKRKEAALSEAKKDAESTLQKLQNTHERKIDVLQKAFSGDLEKEKKATAEQIERLHQAHQSVVDSLKASRAEEMEGLHKEHEATLEKLVSQHQNELQLLRQDHEQAVATLRQQADQTLAQVKQNSERRIQELEDRHTAKTELLNKQISEYRQKQQTLYATISELETNIIELQNQVRESKLNNMFSVSKSGEKLIRVVRSVQELANELDETSRTVTDGEYSFFEQIKDQRDRDVVLSLTGGSPAEAPVIKEKTETATEIQEPAQDPEEESGGKSEEKKAPEDQPG